MLPLFTSEQMRGFDKRAITEFGIPGVVLMENAALAALELIETELGAVDLLTVGILCGPGNNGGDGFALARQLFLRGCDVEIWLLSKPDALTGDAKINFDAAVKLEIPMLEPESADELDFSEYDLVVDAMFGTGLARAPEGLFAEAIETLNQMEIPVLALDLPSGVNADTGDDLGEALDVTYTITFQSGKPGLYLEPGRKHAGEVHIAPISLPISADDALEASYLLPEHEDVAALFPNRPSNSHKGNYGKLLLIAGSRGMSGAARLAAAAALRSGVGLLMVAIPESVRAEVTRQPELMTVGLPETASGCLAFSAWEKLEPLLKWADVVAVGPGLGQDPETAHLLNNILTSGKRLVLDADALNLISAHNLQAKLPAGSILTPHPVEFERLVGKQFSTVHQRIVAAGEFAAKYKVVVHVKGSSAATVTPDKKVFINTTGNPGLATGGSGDVLTGIIGAIFAQGIPASASAWGGAYLHGLAADVAADVLGEVSLLPSDVITHLPSAFAELAPESDDQ